MISCYKHFFLNLFLSTFIFSQYHISSPTELATSGAFLGGKLGTHAIHSNPALLGVKTGDLIERSLVDTFSVLYSVKLANSENKTELKNLREFLVEKDFIQEFEIFKEDSLFFLKAKGFKNSISGYNFSSRLPPEVPLKIILPDTTWNTIEKPIINYRINLLSTTNIDTLKFYKKLIKKNFKDYETYITVSDTLYNYFLNVSNSEEETIMLMNSPKIQSIFKNASIDFFYNSVQEGFSPKISVTFPLRSSIGFENNHVNTRWFNKYIGADMVKNPSVKNDFIRNMPSSGISGVFHTNTSALELTYQNFGISLVNIHTFYKINIPKQLSEIIFEGVQFDKPKDISNFDTRGLVYNESILSYGKKIKFKKFSFNTYLGVGIRYYSGIFSYTNSYKGKISTNRDSIKILSDLSLMINKPGNVASGFGIDLGIYAKINKKISAQASLIGLGGGLNSREANNIKNISHISISNSDINDILDFNDSQIDSLTKTFTILDTTEIVKNISIDLPARVNIAANYILSENVQFKTAFQHTQQTEFTGRIKPQISLGAEIYPYKSYSFLSGISFGGMNKLTFGAGLGLNFKRIRYNFSVNQYGGLLNYAKGLRIASEFQLIF